ncbi:MAG: 1,2-phenylacetyl-CoA epoxidase, subunit E, partial [uncultured Nocardioidaceae bacterium]
DRHAGPAEHPVEHPAEHPGPGRVPHPHGVEGRPAHRGQRRCRLRRPRGAPRGVRLRRGAVAHAAPHRARGRAAAVLLDLRRGGGAAADRGAGGARRELLPLAGPRGAPRHPDRRVDPHRRAPRRPVGGRAAPLHRRRVGHHAAAVDHRLGARQPRGAGDAGLRQPDDQLGDVRRGARGPEEPLRTPLRPRPRPLPRAPRRRALHRAARRRPAAEAADHARPPRGARPRLALRAVRHGDRGAGGAGRARRPPGEGPPRAVLRRRAAAAGPPPRPGGRGRHERGQRGARRPRHLDGRQPHHQPSRGRAADPDRPALRVQGRGVRDLPGAGGGGRGRDGAELRPRAGRGVPAVRAHLPELPGDRAGHRRLRRL